MASVRPISNSYQLQQVTSQSYIKFTLLWLVPYYIFAERRNLSSSIFCLTALWSLAQGLSVLLALNCSLVYVCWIHQNLALKVSIIISKRLMEVLPFLKCFAFLLHFAEKIVKILLNCSPFSQYLKDYFVDYELNWHDNQGVFTGVYYFVNY